MTFPDQIKLGLKFDIQQLQADLARLNSIEWVKNFVTNNYDGDSDILPLRAPKGETHPIRMAYSDPTCNEFVDTEFLEPCSYFQSVIKSFPFELHSVRLMGLYPGSRILEHKDYDLAFEYGAIRMHIPIVTNDKVEFYVNGKYVDMREGECWYLRLSDPHRAFNGGSANRVHMILDAPACPEVSEFLRTNSPEE